MSFNNIEWNDVIKKEARGINDEDFGEVQEIQGNYVLVQKGMINKEKFYILSNYYSNFKNLKYTITRYYRTKRFQLDITKFLLRSTN